RSTGREPQVRDSRTGRTGAFVRARRSRRSVRRPGRLALTPSRRQLLLNNTLDPKAFRDTLGLFATGVAVIATTVEDQLHAMTANAVSSLSLDPMLVLFCAAKRARFSHVLQRAEGFSISFLRDEQEALSTYFAG